MKQYGSVREFVEEMPGLARPHQDALRGNDNIFRVTTSEGLDVYIIIEDGIVSVRDTSEDPPIAIISGPEDKILSIINKPSSAMSVLLFGGLHVRGDVKPLLRLAKLL